MCLLQNTMHVHLPMYIFYNILIKPLLSFLYSITATAYWHSKERYVYPNGLASIIILWTTHKGNGKRIFRFNKSFIENTTLFPWVDNICVLLACVLYGKTKKKVEWVVVQFHIIIMANSQALK